LVNVKWKIPLLGCHGEKGEGPELKKRGRKTKSFARNQIVLYMKKKRVSSEGRDGLPEGRGGNRLEKKKQLIIIKTKEEEGKGVLLEKTDPKKKKWTRTRVASNHQCLSDRLFSKEGKKGDLPTAEPKKKKGKEGCTPQSKKRGHPEPFEAQGNSNLPKPPNS